jgi:flagellar biosynthesis protein FliR
MLTFNEAQVLAWINPLIWPFLRALALFTAMPVLGSRSVPTRVRIALAGFIALASQASLPEMPVVPLDSAQAVLLVVQQVVIGLSLGFAVRVLFAAAELAGELVGLQMGLNFAGFFDPISAAQGTATARFFGTTISWLFVVINGHLLVIAALVDSFKAFPVGPEPMAFIHQAMPHRWAAEVFSTGLWIALPLIAMLMFVNIVLGMISRVAPQINIFAIGFPVTLSVGLLGMFLTLPMMQQPFLLAMDRVLAGFK